MVTRRRLLRAVAVTGVAVSASGCLDSDEVGYELVDVADWEFEGTTVETEHGDVRLDARSDDGGTVVYVRTVAPATNYLAEVERASVDGDELRLSVVTREIGEAGGTAITYPEVGARVDTEAETVVADVLDGWGETHTVEADVR